MIAKVSKTSFADFTAKLLILGETKKKFTNYWSLNRSTSPKKRQKSAFATQNINKKRIDAPKKCFSYFYFVTLRVETDAF